MVQEMHQGSWDDQWVLQPFCYQSLKRLEPTVVQLLLFLPCRMMQLPLHQLPQCQLELHHSLVDKTSCQPYAQQGPCWSSSWKNRPKRFARRQVPLKFSFLWGTWALSLPGLMHVNKRWPCDCMRACQYLSCQVRRRSRLMKKAQGLTTGDLAWLIARRAAEWGYSIHASEKDAVELQQKSSSFSSKAEGELCGCIRRRRWSQHPCACLKKAAYWVIKVTVWKAKGDMSGSVTFENVARRDKCEFNQGIRFKGSHVESFANPNFMCRNHFGCFIFCGLWQSQNSHGHAVWADQMFRPCHFTLGVENRFWSQIL